LNFLSLKQNTGDLKLLEAFRLYFQSVGKIYDKKDGVSVYMVRNMFNINKIIIPFFLEYPLVGTKSIEFEKFIQFMNLVLSKNHLGKELLHRDIFIEMALLCKELNSKRINPQKLHRIHYLINWLKSLDKVPSLEEKLNMKIGVSSKKKN